MEGTAEGAVEGMRRLAESATFEEEGREEGGSRGPSKSPREGLRLYGVVPSEGRVAARDDGEL